MGTITSSMIFANLKRMGTIAVRLSNNNSVAFSCKVYIFQNYTRYICCGHPSLLAAEKMPSAQSFSGILELEYTRVLSTGFESKFLDRGQPEGSSDTGMPEFMPHL